MRSTRLRHPGSSPPTAAAGVPPGLRRVARLLFWLMLAFVAFVTLSPIAYRPETPFGPNVERFAAFAIVSALMVLGHPRHLLAGLLGLLAAAGLLEASQGVVDGRHAQMHDFAVKAAGAAAGAIAALAVARVAAVSRG